MSSLIAESCNIPEAVYLTDGNSIYQHNLILCIKLLKENQNYANISKFSGKNGLKIPAVHRVCFGILLGTWGTLQLENHLSKHDFAVLTGLHYNPGLFQSPPGDFPIQEGNAVLRLSHRRKHQFSSHQRQVLIEPQRDSASLQ